MKGKKKKGLKKLLNIKSISLLLVVVLSVVFFALGGFNSLQNAIINARNMLDDNTQMGTKSKTENSDGTTTLSLTVTGDVTTKASKANVIVVFDTSNSMSTNTNTGGYNASNNTSNVRGLVEGEFLPLTRRTVSGSYHYYYTKDDVEYEYTGQRYAYDNNQERLEAAKSAVNMLGSSLLAYNTKEGYPNDTIQMALVNFATNADVVGVNTNNGITTSKDTFESRVNGLSYYSSSSPRAATNWEEALNLANTISFGDNDPTYVIFVSDGNPTFRSTRDVVMGDGVLHTYTNDGSHYNTYNVYGTGSEGSTENINRCYYAALPASKAIVDAGKNLYSIGIYSRSLDRVKTLITTAGAPEDNYFPAGDTDDLIDALNQIMEDIKKAGISNATINDPTTNQVATSSSIVNLLDIEKDSEGKPIFTYYRTINGTKTEWKTTDNPAPPAAEFTTDGKVKWDLTSLKLLDNDVTYEVNFNVYPSQYTYDLIADLRNGTKDYNNDNDVPPEVRQYLHKNGNTYTLDTNTRNADGTSTATITYTDTRITDPTDPNYGTQTYTYTNPTPVGTNVETISVEKIWDNDIDGRKDRAVQLELKRDGSKVLDISLDGKIDNNIELETLPGEETQPWKASNIFIATGLAKTVNGNLVVLDAGHDYTFGELGSEAYNWELESITVHPMIIDGTLTELTLVEGSTTCPSGETCYTINNKLYKVSGNNPTITATNHRRSNINITKTVDGESADPDQEFEFTIKIDQKDENNQTIPSVDTKDHNDYLWFSVQDSDGNWVDYGDTISGWARYQGTDNLTGKTTYYYYAPNGSTAVVNLKAGYNVRYTNLISNTYFTVSEKAVDNYKLDSITSNDDSTESNKINLTTKTIDGKIANTNKSYNVEFKNVYELIDITVDKVWDDTTGDGVMPDSIDVTLLADGQKAPVDNATVTLTENKDGNWTYTWTGLDRFKNDKEITYDVQEITDADVLAHYISTKEYAKVENEDGTETEDKQHVIITNTRDPRDITVNKSGTKTWTDNNDQDGMRPDSITVNLKGTITVKDPKTGENVTKTVHTATKTVRADASGNWTYEFTNLPKYSEGEEIVYTATDTVDGYTATDNSMNITNTHIPSKIDISGNKQWVDDDNQDGIRPTSIQVTLTGTIKVLDPETGEPTGETTTVHTETKTVSANAEGKWLYKFEGVPQYNSGQEIAYEVSENAIDGYTATYPARTYNIVNVHISEVDDIEGIKSWDDANDQDGLRPDEITVNLTGTIKVTDEATGEEIDQVVVTDSTTATAAGNWAYKFENKPVKNSGKTITYTVTETAIDGYTASKGEGQYDIKNTHTPATTSVSGEKIWDDSNNQDGMRKPITVQLYANGTAVEGKTVQLPNADGSWTYSFTDLPEKASGQTIEYSVQEVSVPSGYTESYPAGTYNIKNTHTPLTENVEGHKIWDDGEETEGVDQDGVRPGTIYITLYKSTTVDGKTTKTEVETKPVTKDDNWSWSWKGLPQYENGHKITYTVEEGKVDYYTSTIENDTYNIKNTHTPFKASVKVIKKWTDGNNQDGKRPDIVTFVLKDSKGLMIPDQDGNTTITLNENNSWTFEKTGLPRKAAGKDIEYTATEISTDPNYKQSKPVVTTSTNEDKANQEYTITVENVHTPGVVNVQGTKSWNDDNDRDRVRPTSITVNLTGTIKYESESGTIVTEPVTISQETTKTVTAADGWSWSWTGLPEYSNGHEITYAVSEETVAGYEASAGKGQYDIVNTHEIATTDVTIKKVWADDNNRDLLRPTQVLITLYANGTEYDQYPVTIEDAINANEWEITIEDLPLNENGQPIVYTAQEKVTSETETDVPEGYSQSYSGTTVTNTHTPEATQISGKKVWKDDSDRDGKRPASITINVYDEDDKSTIVKSETVNGNNTDEEWSYTITGLNKYKNVGGQRTKINYVVDEVLPEGYTKSIDGTTITNTYNTEKVNIPVSKTWVDEKGEEYRPESVTIKLLADNVDTGKTVELNEDNKWASSFNDLPVNKDHGTGTVTYTVEEVIEEGSKVEQYYDVSYPETGEDEGFVVVNTIKDLSKDIPVAKIWDDQNNRDNARPTTITYTLTGTVPGKEKPVVERELDLTINDVDANDPNKWNSVFENVPIFHEGTWITYTVNEKAVAGYTPVSNETVDGVVTITNNHELTTIDLTATKSWDDNEDNDGKRPEKVLITLYADGVEQETKEATEGSDWKVTFEGLVKYAKGEIGREIVYTVAEKEDNIPEGYTPSVTGNTITNTHEALKITYKVTKDWHDFDNNDGKRPDHITVRLVGKVGDTVVTEKVKDVYEINEGFENEPWTYAFTDLPKYYNKELVQYTITEDNVDLYETQEIEQVTITEEKSAYENTITNTHSKIPYNETGTITVNKYWYDENDKYKKRPGSITVNLLADGEIYQTAELTAENGWTVTFENLPMYTIRDGEVGCEIVYSIQEVAVENYETTIDGFDITNTYNGPVPEITPPNTGVAMTKRTDNNVLFEMIVTALAASYTIVVARRANEQ